MFRHQSQGFIQRIQRPVASALIATMLLLDFPILMSMQAAQAAPLMTDPADWVEVNTPNDPMMENLNVPANAASAGMWSPVFNWPMNGLHNSVLPDGKVLTYGTTASGQVQDGRLFDVWDPTLGFGANSHNSSYQAQQQDSFCSTAAFLNDGTMLITGGNAINGGYGKGSMIYNPVNNKRTTAAASTALPRWYATMLTLPDSRKMVMGGMQPYTEGMWVNPDQSVQAGYASMTPEVYENNQWRSLFGASSRNAFGPDFLRTSYPHAFVAPNGQVFGISAEKMWYLDPNANGGNGAIPYVGNFKRGFGNMADPVNVGALSVAVMYDIGKIIQVGGNGGNNGDGFAASNMATVFDINNGAPQLTEQQRMNFPRRYGNGLVLANGQVVITGGTTLGNYNIGDERNRGSQAVFAAEIWDPNTGNWTVGASAATIRVYHSITSLLTNGTVLSTGGGAPGPVTNLSGEVYYPPYLFTQSGNGSELAERPVIDAISGLKYSHNAPIEMDMASNDPVSSLVLIGLSSGTHSFNVGQRRIPLGFTQEDNRLTATTPNANLTPPGYYQVVALDAQGVPSYGVVVAIGQDLVAPNVPTNPYTPPEVDDNIAVPVISAGGTANYTATAVNGYTYSWNFGDGSASTAYNADPTVSHTYTQAGAYVLTLSIRDNNNIVTTKTVMQAVATSQTAQSPTSASPLVTDANGRVWVVNPDNDSVSVIDGGLIAEIAVGQSPRSVAIGPDGRVWVTNKASATISIIDSVSIAVVGTVALPRASQPHGLAFAPNGSAAYVALEATGQLLKLNVNTGSQIATTTLGLNVRGIAVSADSNTVLVSRFITPPLPGESTLNIDSTTQGGEVIAVNADSMSVNKTIMLRHSDKVDNEIQGSGLPNYLAAPVISPDGQAAWVPSKQDNIKRGAARSGQNLDFQNTVRAISSKIDMSTLTEDYAKRVDHDNSSVGSAAVYHPNGVYLFVALETSRQVAVVDAIKGNELFKIDVGLAPQGVALSEDGNTLYVQEFMSRTVRSVDLTPLTVGGQLAVSVSTAAFSITNEKLPPNVLAGKQMFYDAKDSRLAKDSYMSCASCHNDAGSDGRVWDLTGFGEGLRNTITLNGRASTGHGLLHWSANFDELQDFEGQIRALSGGTGLMSDADFNAGTRSEPLGDKKAGVSGALDQLADYIESLVSFAKTPYRSNDGSLTNNAVAGKEVFKNSCASCHAGTNFTMSNGTGNLKNIGTLTTASGQRLNSALNGIDIPTLRDVWASAPYLHNGSAATIPDAVQAHSNVTLNATELTNVSAYVQQIGSEEASLGGDPENLAPSAILATSYVSPWENLAAVNNGTSHVNSADKNGGAYGNWRGEADYGATDWVSFSWDTAKTLNAFEVYWWNDGAGIATPNTAVVEYWNNNAWVSLGNINTVLNQYNRIDFAEVATTSIRVSMSSDLATGILEASVWGTNGDTTPPTPNVAPTVNLTSPIADAIYTSGDMIALAATATDSDGVITKVEFYDGQTLISTDTTAPYNRDWPAEAGNHSITAKAYDDDGAVTTSSPVNVKMNANVVVNFNSPTAGTTFTENDVIPISVTATAADSTIVKVDFYDGQTLLNTDTVAPYTFDWNNASVGAHTLRAEVFDNFGALSVRVVSITVEPAANIAPTVSLTAPAANATYLLGDAITVTATAADRDGTVASVAFYDGANLLGVDTTAPYSYTWNDASVGTHGISVRATDNDGAQTNSASVNVSVREPDNVEPEVSIVVPNTNVTLLQGDPYTITASASDRDGSISKVEFYYNGSNLLGIKTAAPYTITGSTAGIPIGEYSIIARAYDNEGAITTSAPVVVTVTNELNRPPTVNVTSPVGSSTYTVGDTINITATAADSDGTITKVEFYDGPILLGVDTSAPYAYTWNGASEGAHSITTRATDNDGAVTTSTPVDVNVNSSVPPTVSLNAPAITTGEAVELTATAADADGSVVSVEFYDGATLLHTDTTAPYSYTWNTAVQGVHSMTAKAVDNTGATATSSTVNVNVDSTYNDRPIVNLITPIDLAEYSVGDVVALTATATDTDGSIANVAFYSNGELLNVDTTAPYTFNWTATKGIHAISALATDNQGAFNRSSTANINVIEVNNNAPTVTLTAPADNASYTEGDVLTLSATASDADGSIVNVRFIDETGRTLFNDTQAPYTFNWTNVAEGTYQVAARAWDDGGSYTTSSFVTITVNTPTNAEPEVAIVVPNANVTLSQGDAYTITASASDRDGSISKVEFYYNESNLLDIKTAAPYTTTGSTAGIPAGEYSITAKAYDNNGAVMTSEPVVITVR